MSDQTFTRRSTLARLGGLVAAAAGGRALLTDEAEGGNKAVESGAVACVLTPELTEGPYYIAGEKLRRDIREGHPGRSLTLRLRVLNASTCKPIKGAAVDIWHADAAGNYSGFGAGASSRTFLRGIQKTDANGLAIFTTIYPGLVPGPHRAHPRQGARRRRGRAHGAAVLQRLADATPSTRRRRTPPRPNRDVRNAQDSIFVNGGKRGLLALKKNGAGYVGTISMGVHK